MSQHLASSKRQSRRLSAQRHASTGKIFLESHQGIVYNPLASYFNSQKFRLQCSCKQPEFQYTHTRTPVLSSQYHTGLHILSFISLSFRYSRLKGSEKRCARCVKTHSSQFRYNLGELVRHQVSIFHAPALTLSQPSRRTTRLA